MHKGILQRIIPFILVAAACFGQGYTISSVAGGGLLSNPLPAPATSEYLEDETGIAVDGAGNIFFGGGTDNVIYKVSGGTLSIVAGTRKTGYTGDGGPAINATLNDPQGVALDSAGNLYVVDYLNYVVREISASDGTIRTIAGTGSYGPPVPGPATASPMYQPTGVAVDASGNVYISSGLAGGFILKVANGVLSIAAGIGTLGPVTSGASATTQPIAGPRYITVDAAGNVYIPTQANGQVLELVVATGTLTVLAGNGNDGFSGDGGPATDAAILPFGAAVDSAGNLYIADSNNGAIRKVTNGIITTIAGRGSTVGDACSGGPYAATTVQLNHPNALVVSGAKIYFANSEGCIQLLTNSSSTSGPPSTGGIASASAFGDFTSAAPGSWVEIYGSNLATDTRGWTTADFQGGNAPISLDGTSVTIGGQAAFIDYISPGQVNAQVPSNVPSGSQSVVVKTPSGSAAGFSITINSTQPGLLAPTPSFAIGGKQYIAALFTDGVTYVLPTGAIPGVPSRPAQPGETIVFYGVGFGSVSPSIPAGQIVTQNNQLVVAPQISIGGALANVTYAGLAPSAIGLYQFNVVVPTLPANNLTPVTFTLGGVPGVQTLYTAVQ